LNLESGKENVEDVMNNFFPGGNTMDPGEDMDLFDNIEQILNDDIALGFISNRIDGMDNEKIREVANPFLQMFRSGGVEMFSAGNPDRAEKFKAGMDSLSSYVAIVRRFLPAFRVIYQFLSENRTTTGTLNDEEWDEMMSFDNESVEGPRTETQVDPKIIDHPTEQRSYSGDGVNPSVSASDGMSLKSIFEHHMEKFGSKGMGKVISELEGKENISLGIRVKETLNVMPATEMSAGQNGPSSEPKGIKNLKLSDMVEKHRQQFGEEGMDKVIEEMKSAELDTGGIENRLEASEACVDDERDSLFDDDGDSSNGIMEAAAVIKRESNNTAALRRRMDDMPRPSNMPNPFERDDYLDGD
jgi:hypothetical protein